MISDEVRMLLNRMETNPNEFFQDRLEFGDMYRVRESRTWDSLMNSIIHNKPDLEVLFTPEEIKALRDKASEIARPRALATIVRTIVGGEDKPQMELDITDSTVYKKRALITQADLLRMQCDAEYLKNVAQQERFK
jgi:hypothetical protein